MIRSEHEQVECVIDDQRTKGSSYYRNLCFHTHAMNASKQFLELIDGGAVDWAQKLLSNARERLVISGIGSERLCSEFGNMKGA